MKKIKILLVAAIMAATGMGATFADVTVAVGDSTSVNVPGYVKNFNTSVASIISTVNATTSIQIHGVAVGTTVLTINQYVGSPLVENVTVIPDPPPSTVPVTLNINQTLTFALPGTYVSQTNSNSSKAQLQTVDSTDVKITGQATGTTNIVVKLSDTTVTYSVTVTSQVVASYAANNFGTGMAQQYQQWPGAVANWPNNPSAPTYITIVPTGNVAYQQLLSYHATAEAYAAANSMPTSGIRRYVPYAEMFGANDLVGQGMITLTYPSVSSQIVLEATWTTAYMNQVEASHGTTGIYNDPAHGISTAVMAPSTPTNAIYGSAGPGGEYNISHQDGNNGWCAMLRVPNTPLSIFMSTSDDDVGYGSSWNGYSLLWVAPGSLPNDPQPPSGTITPQNARVLPTSPVTVNWSVSNG